MPGSEAFITKNWRRRRNEQVVRDARTWQHSLPYGTRLETQVSVLETHCDMINAVAFHPFDDQLVLADAKSNVGVWQWRERRRMNFFPNQNPTGSHLTSLQLVNAHDVALLMTGSGLYHDVHGLIKDDGVVRVYRHYDRHDEMELVSAWRSITDMLPDETGSGLVMEWQQASGSLLVSGDVKTIKIWDANRETCSTVCTRITIK
jgi:regulator-associated protein of mTOR